MFFGLHESTRILKIFVTKFFCQDDYRSCSNYVKWDGEEEKFDP